MQDLVAESSTYHRELTAIASKIHDVAKKQNMEAPIPRRGTGASRVEVLSQCIIYPKGWTHFQISSLHVHLPANRVSSTAKQIYIIDLEAPRCLLDWLLLLCPSIERVGRRLHDSFICASEAPSSNSCVEVAHQASYPSRTLFRLPRRVLSTHCEMDLL